MANPVSLFLERHSSLILTTHDRADADGLGAEKAFSYIAGKLGKKVRIINSGPVPEHFRFMDPDNSIEIWKDVKDTINENCALVILDTTDEYNIGDLKDFISCASEVFVIDHHEPNQFCEFSGLIDNTASSTCELVVEYANEVNIRLTPESAMAAYAGMVYDTGFFSYSKTTGRTFRAALVLVETGVKPYFVYKELNESSSNGTLLLQKKVLSTLEIHNKGRVATQILSKDDLISLGARYEDAENFINIPMKSKEIEVSILVKENKEGQVRCSLRSKGSVNVSKMAQIMGGGGHVNAAGFKSSLDIKDTLEKILSVVTEDLEKS